MLLWFGSNSLLLNATGAEHGMNLCPGTLSKSRIGSYACQAICRLGEASFCRGNPNRDIERLSKHPILQTIGLS